MDILRCLLLPIQGKTLIVPYSAVAEVIPYEDIQASSKGDLVSGKFNWRGMTIPLVCLERQDNPSFQCTPGQSLHVAILNRSTDSEGQDFIGLILQGLPSMNRFKRSDIQSAAASTDKPYLSMQITAKGKPAFIPNLTWIQAHLADFAVGTLAKG